MILAGIDEAGYGPILGPLTVGCCAVRVPGSDVSAPPQVWDLLRRCVSQKRDRTGRRIHVGDSKQVYSPSAGLGELERSVLTWLSAAGLETGSFATVLEQLTQHGEQDLKVLSRIPWYATGNEQHPAEASATNVAIGANALRLECAAVGVELLTHAVSVVAEPRFNQLCDATRNKSSVLFTTAMGHVDRLLRAWLEEDRDEPLLIVCDRHGGRSHYGSLLRLMFEDWDLGVESESEKRAEYVLTRRSRSARLVFAEKADGTHLPTAMASMLAKYVRERLMGRLNAWWQARVPELRPTAGYWTDGQRFLTDIAGIRKELGVADRQLVRSR